MNLAFDKISTMNLAFDKISTMNLPWTKSMMNHTLDRISLMNLALDIISCLKYHLGHNLRRFRTPDVAVKKKNTSNFTYCDITVMKIHTGFMSEEFLYIFMYIFMYSKGKVGG